MPQKEGGSEHHLILRQSRPGVLPIPRFWPCCWYSMHTSTTHLVLCEDKPCDALPPLNASPTEKVKSPSADAIEWYRSWYLGLGARSLLALVSPILVAIVFVLVRIAMSSSHLNARVADAKQEWLAGCGSAQEEISHLRNWAYYAAPSVNAATQKEVQETVHALGHVLVLRYATTASVARFS